VKEDLNRRTAGIKQKNIERVGSEGVLNQ